MVSLLSLMSANVVRKLSGIKHVFEVCCGSTGGAVVAPIRSGKLVGGLLYRSQQFDHMFYRSNTLAIIFEHKSEQSGAEAGT